MALKILPFFGRDKEKETLALFRKHAEVIASMSKPLQEAVDAAFKKKDFELTEERCKELNKLEKEADFIRKKTAAMLYAGAFLPMMRSRLYDFSGRLDDVADTIQDAANLLHYMKGKKIPKEFIDILHKLGQTAAKSASMIKPAIEALFENKKNFDRLMNDIKTIESEADHYERELFNKLFFKKNMDATAMHVMSWVGIELSKVADKMKKVSDTMVLVKIMNVA